MRYIRTEDGIFEDRFIKIKVFKDGSATMEYKGNFYELPLKIKQADTIEELCDEFVVIGYKMKDPFIFSKEGISIDDFWKHSPSDTIVYGAIWCEFGLKYVAKMNDEGELKLL